LHCAASFGFVPVGTGEQIPGVAASAHVMQVPSQAESQQMPSTQKPLLQSAWQPHACPSSRAAPASLAQVVGGGREAERVQAAPSTSAAAAASAARPASRRGRLDRSASR
jgi:hypothetical protein